MLDPYRMIVVNVIASLILGGGILIYKYVYPKKSPKLFYVLLLISFLPLISILRKGTYESGDLSLHAKFAMQFFENLQLGNYFPEWIGRHCSGYGCPTYLFLFILPYYLISLFHFLGLSFIASIKLLIMLTYIFSGIGMFIWIKNELGEKAGFVASIFYLFSPYHLIDLHFRVSIGELVSMAFLPYIFFYTKKLIETSRPLYFVLNAILFALLILSHQVTSLASLPLILIYAVFVYTRNKKRKLSRLLIMCFSLLYGIFLSAFYWIPILFEGKLTWYKVQDAIYFHPLSSFLYSPFNYRFGLLFQGHMGEFYLNIGYTQWIIIATSLYLLLRKMISGKDRILLWGCMIIFITLFFMMQSISKPVWDFFPFLKSFQFAWRFLIEIMFIVSIMAAIVVKKFPKNSFIITLCTITILYTILNWGNRRVLPEINDTILRNQTVFDEHRGPTGVDLTTPKWVDPYKPWIANAPKYHIETLSGKAEFTSLERNITKHEYIIQVKNDSLIKENTYYYPGWRVLVNNKEIPIIYTNKNYPGVITFYLKKGIYKVDLVFTDTADRTISKYVSLAAFVLLIFYSIFSYFKKSSNIK